MGGVKNVQKCGLSRTRFTFIWSTKGAENPLNLLRDSRGNRGPRSLT